MITDANKLRTFIDQISPIAEIYGKKDRLIKNEQGDAIEEKCTISKIHDNITELENSTSVLFCGEFKRGKSSLVNAIIGEKLCPTAIGIATSVVSIIRYGTAKKAYRYYGNLLEDTDSLKKEEIEWQDIEKYTMGDVLDIDNTILVEFFYPAPFLKDGITIIDTPGIGGLDPRHAILTHMALPKADVIVFVTDAGEPMTESELKFYKEKIVPCGKQNLILINKADTLTEDILKTHIDETTLKLSKFDNSGVLPVSAKHWINYNLSENDKSLVKSNKNCVLASISTLVEKFRKKQLIGLRDMLITEISDISNAVKTEIEQLNADSTTHQSAMESLKQQLEELKLFISDIKNPQSVINLRINSIFEDARNEVSNTISHEGTILSSTEFDGLLKSEHGLDEDGKWLTAQINDRLNTLSNVVDKKMDEAFEKISKEIEWNIADILTIKDCHISEEMRKVSVINSQMAFSLAGKVAMSGGILSGAAFLGLISGPIGWAVGIATAAGLIWRSLSKEVKDKQMQEIRQQVFPKVNLAITDLRNQANTRFSKFHQNLLQTLQTLASEAEEKIKAIQKSMIESHGNEQECKNKIAALQQRDKFLQTLTAQLNLLYSNPFSNAK